MLDFRGYIVTSVSTAMGQVSMYVSAVVSATFCAVDVTDDCNFGHYFELFVQISLTSTS